MKTPNLKTCPKWQRVLSRSERKHLWQDMFPPNVRPTLAGFKAAREAQKNSPIRDLNGETCFECRMIAKALGLE